MLNGLYIGQKGQYYAIFTPQGIQIGLLFLGQDGQYAKDVAALGPYYQGTGEALGCESKGLSMRHLTRGAAYHAAPLLFILFQALFFIRELG